MTRPSLARRNDQIVLRYKENPNGSRDDIAGVSNVEGNVVGLMPHPSARCPRCSVVPTDACCSKGSWAHRWARTSSTLHVPDPLRRVERTCYVLAVIIVLYWVAWYAHRSLVASENSKVYVDFEHPFLSLTDSLSRVF